MVNLVKMGGLAVCFPLGVGLEGMAIGIERFGFGWVRECWLGALSKRVSTLGFFAIRFHLCFLRDGYRTAFGYALSLSCPSISMLALLAF